MSSKGYFFWILAILNYLKNTLGMIYNLKKYLVLNTIYITVKYNIFMCTNHNTLPNTVLCFKITIINHEKNVQKYVM